MEFFRKVLLKRIFVCLGFAGIFLFSACVRLGSYTTSLGTYSAITTRELDLKNVAVSRLPEKNDCVGIANVPVIFGILPLGRYPKISEAVENAFEVNGGDLMLDVKIREKAWSCFVWGGFGYEVTGTIVDTRVPATTKEATR